MKIGILTQRLHSNYGGLLQNYALHKVLKDNGHTALTIDWKPGSRNLKWYLSVGGLYILHAILPSMFEKPSLGYTLTKEEDAIITKHMRYFREKYLPHTRIMKSSKDFKKCHKEYAFEGYVVGSDQCWRPCYNRFQREMFLSFIFGLNDIKRISYAASFGSDKWEYDDVLTADCAKYAQEFDAISVREDSGVNLCKHNLGVEAKHVLDPTMLLDKEDYIALVKAENEEESCGNLYYYFLDPSDEKKNALKTIAARTGLKPFSVIPKYNSDHRTKENVKNEIGDCVYPSVTKWLRAFMDAEMVVVDSFHGMVFSIIFNKPFWVLGNPKRGMSRFLSLLKIFHLENRLVTPDTLEQLDFWTKINWDEVNRIRGEWRNLSLSFLNDNLGE